MKFKQYQFLRQEAIKRLKAKEIRSAYEKISLPIDIAKTLDPIMLAYIGDAVYSMYVRVELCSISISKVQILHALVTDFINAKAQATSFSTISNLLNESEALIARRARNSHVNVPKSSSVQEYRASTAFEAILGFLYITKQKERLNTFMDTAFSITLETL
ncbi:Mini-ribonuclease 3 [Veillonella montpellierensis]|uniref:Mini-ribonuclease 3 n=1 Tax=Veillonella montpellierensis TaxID=187328 RepID=UPI0023F6DEEB|nr:ribonuclease III domain-containing protein [Veillonella montpellierensis]